MDLSFHECLCYNALDTSEKKGQLTLAVDVPDSNSMPHEITLEQLAQMVQRGFEHTATRKDLERHGDRLDDVDNRLDGVGRQLDSIDYEIRQIKTVLGPSCALLHSWKQIFTTCSRACSGWRRKRD